MNPQLTSRSCHKDALLCRFDRSRRWTKIYVHAISRQTSGWGAKSAAQAKLHISFGKHLRVLYVINSRGRGVVMELSFQSQTQGNFCPSHTHHHNVLSKRLLFPRVIVPGQPDRCCGAIVQWCHNQHRSAANVHLPVHTCSFSHCRKPTAKEKKKAADDFSDDLRDKHWEYGKCNDDFVIFVSSGDRQVRTEKLLISID